MPVDIIGYVYSSCVAAGGVLGFVKAGSVPSLVAGLTFGVILGYGAHLNSQDTPQPLLQLSTSLVLGAMMGSKFIKTKKIMPAGIVCLLSCVVFANNLIQHKNYLPIIGNQK